MMWLALSALSLAAEPPAICQESQTKVKDLELENLQLRAGLLTERRARIEALNAQIPQIDTAIGNISTEIEKRNAQAKAAEKTDARVDVKPKQ